MRKLAIVFTLLSFVGIASSASSRENLVVLEGSRAIETIASLQRSKVVSIPTDAALVAVSIENLLCTATLQESGEFYHACSFMDKNSTSQIRISADSYNSAHLISGIAMANINLVPSNDDRTYILKIKEITCEYYRDAVAPTNCTYRIR